MNIKELYPLFKESNGICTDTRKLKTGQLFFALKGDNFNGNLYAIKAIEDGAKYAIIDDERIKNKNCIVVENVLSTLQELAKYHRIHLNTPIIGLTGSNGKTTTKELINVVLETKYNTEATLGNLNNHIGVPLTLLNFKKENEIGIVEMGANHLKEIDLLCSICLPNYGYITNIGKAHLEGFGSEKNILLAKTELYQHIESSKGIIFSNSDDKKLAEKAQKLTRIEFGKSKKAKFQIEFISADPFVKIKYNNTEITSNLIGEYNYTNIAASVCIGLHFKVPIENIKKAIEGYVPKINRSELVQTKTNKIILDAYNANPTSMKAAIENFLKTDSTLNKTLVLGDMFELGVYTEKEHQYIVNLIQDNPSLSRVLLAGENFSKCDIINERVSTYKNTNILLEKLKKDPIKNNYVLIKGSRGMTLERCTDYL